MLAKLPATIALMLGLAAAPASAQTNHFSAKQVNALAALQDAYLDHMKTFEDGYERAGRSGSNTDITEVFFLSAVCYFSAYNAAQIAFLWVTDVVDWLKVLSLSDPASKSYGIFLNLGKQRVHTAISAVTNQSGKIDDTRKVPACAKNEPYMTETKNFRELTDLTISALRALQTRF
jgi:hypothetical protein